jgi:hypothetical protein
VKRTFLIWLTVAAVAVLVVTGFTWLTRLEKLPTATLGRTQAQTAASALATTDPKGVFADIPATGCSVVELPQSRVPLPPSDEIGTSLDIYSRKLQISYYDPQLRADRKIYISIDDPTCRENPRLKLLIDHVLKIHAENIADACRSFTEIVRNGRSEIKGQKVDLEGANRFLERWCK